MYKTILLLLRIIWVIDILNISFSIGGVNVAEFLDVTFPFNFWAWTLTFIVQPAPYYLVKQYESFSDIIEKRFK